MSEPVEQGRGHLGIAEDGSPFGEAEIGGDDHAGALIELASAGGTARRRPRC